MPVHHGIVGCVRFQRLFRIAEDEADWCVQLVDLGPGARQHGFGEIKARHVEPDVMEQERDHTRAARNIEDRTALTLAEMTANNRCQPWRSSSLKIWCPGERSNVSDRLLQ